MHGMLIERTYLNAWGRIANPNNRKLRERYAELCTDVIINLNDGNARETWFTFYQLDDYANAVDELEDLGCHVHFMTWVRPKAPWLNGMIDDCLELLDRTQARSLLCDLEGPWARSKASKREDAAEAIGEAFCGRDWGFTDVPMVKWSKVAPIAERASYWMPQCHTFGRRNGIKPRPWYRTPGKLERWTHKKWSKRLEVGQRIIPHLADYNVGSYRQTAPGLRESIATCHELGYTELAAWCPLKGPKNPQVWKGLKYER